MAYPTKDPRLAGARMLTQLVLVDTAVSNFDCTVPDQDAARRLAMANPELVGALRNQIDLVSKEFHSIKARLDDASEYLGTVRTPEH
jgi:hypothetical protein